MTKKLSTIENRNIDKINKKINQARKNQKLFFNEIAELKLEKAAILCPYSINDEVIRSDGRRGKVSKIVLDANSNAVFSVFLQKQSTRNFQYRTGEHYRTKADEVWKLFH